jgi:hypothetical protein
MTKLHTKLVPTLAGVDAVVWLTSPPLTLEQLNDQDFMKDPDRILRYAA